MFCFYIATLNTLRSYYIFNISNRTDIKIANSPKYQQAHVNHFYHVPKIMTFYSNIIETV